MPTTKDRRDYCLTPNPNDPRQVCCRFKHEHMQPDRHVFAVWQERK